jgi:DNA-binding transcriptional regulator YhcF (GntR family)
LQIADALQAAVVDASLKPGDRLPPQRQLAAQLDVGLTTITRAYDETRNWQRIRECNSDLVG